MISVGEILKKQRLKKQITLEQVEKDLRIRKKYLEKIENNNWDFTSKTYLIGILKNYARYLELDENKIFAFFRREYAKVEEIEFKKRISSALLSSDTNKLIKITSFLIGIIFLFYFGFQIYNYFSPPTIEIISPKTNYFTKEKVVKIKGKTKSESQVFINENEVYLDKNGFFSFNFPLEKEKNELKIKVIGPNGKKTVLEKIFYKKN